MRASSQILKVINLHFNSLFQGREFILPEEILTTNVYEVICGVDKYAPRITLLVSRDNSYCDYLIRTDSHMSHQRIYIDGTVKPLESYEAQFGWPVLENEIDTKIEHERIRNHNEKVHQILLKKGLIKN